MKSKFMLLAVTALMVLSMHASFAKAQDDLESDFQAEDSKNLKVDSQLAEQEAKQTDEDLRSTEKKANKLSADNLRLTQSIQNANARIESNKKELEATRGKIEKMQIDLVNGKKELERLQTEYAEITKEKIQAREEAVRTAQELHKVEAAKRSAAIRLSASHVKRASHKSAKNTKRRSKRVA